MTQEPHSVAPQDLISLFRRQPANNLWYNGKEVTLDGYDFTGCRFDHCSLQVHTSNFSLRRCFISSDTTISFGQTLVAVIKLFNTHSRANDELYPHFIPERHEDGTISIQP
jgi:hypothetical protein